MNSNYQHVAARHARLALKVLMVVGLVAPVGPPAMAWTLSGGGVWNIPNARRIAYDPATGAIGNMGAAGVVYNIAAAPAGAQAGAAGQVTAAFTRWDALGELFVRINLVSGAAAGANVPVSWVPLVTTPGATQNALINFDPRPIQLDNSLTLRTDRWSLDYAGTRPDPIDEYDVYTTSVHEVGHSIGLGHAATNFQVMTPQDSARQNVGGSWRTIEQTTPFGGQPTKLNGAALPNGAKAYNDARAALAAGDRTGARTIYSSPLVRWGGDFTPQGFGGIYSYSFVNESVLETDYHIREGFIPMHASVLVSNMTVQSPEWQITREPGGVRVQAVTGAGLAPGEQLQIAFDADQPPIGVLPSTRWRIPSLEPCGRGNGDLSGDPDGCLVPSFNPSDFAVLDGTYTYALVGESWQIVPGAAVPAPIPEPVTVHLVGVTLFAFAYWRRTRGASK